MNARFSRTVKLLIINLLFQTVLFSQEINQKEKVETKITVDLGYREQKEVNGISLQMHKPFTKKQLSKAHSRRAAIDPVIGHLKANFRLG